MINHLAALRTALAPLGYTTHLIWAAEVTSQYLVLTGPAWGNDDELPVCGLSDAFQTDVRITAVTGTPEGVGTMLTRVRALLSPARAWTRVPLADRDVWTRFERSEFITVDQDTTITGTGRHPAVGVNTYRLTSEPT